MIDDVTAAAGPLLGAILAGGLIGLEREWRGRSAGFRTHILVALAAAVLMQAAVRQPEWHLASGMDGTWIQTDPTRMAHGILTGIGFLCAGVIFRTGFSVHGLTTAASLWISSAIGTLFGVGMGWLGAVATATTLAILIVLRIVSERMPSQRMVHLSVVWRRNGPAPREAIEALLKKRDSDFHRGVRSLDADHNLRRQTFRLRATDIDLNSLSDDLAAVPEVVEFCIDPRED